MQWGWRIVCGLGCLLLLSGLTGCDPFSQPRSLMDEYVERVARVMEQEPVYTPLPAVGPMPRRRARLLELPELDIGMLDFLSLYGCELQVVVGERNSIMGRMMQPLNQLRYEQRFLRAAKACLPQLERDDLKQAVQQAIDGKTDSLGIAAWNATWGGEAIEPLLTQAKGPLPLTGSGPEVAQLAADLNQWNAILAALLAGDLNVSLQPASEMQQRWQSNHAAGQLIRSALLVTTRLDDATRLLQQRIDGRPLCLDGKVNPKARNAEGLLVTVFAGEVQPYLAQVRQRRDQLLEPLAQMATLQSAVMPPAFRQWHQRVLDPQHPDGLWRAFDQAIVEHARSWQRLLEQCGLAPG
ncbi:DUF3080 domain-containing protein [Marinobacter sp. CA1]|uniref:DUF3080 family protein n=2 Tax=Marinobacter TaxID=2742 RepID=UPI0020045D69|nr:DUF3080 family protein [Marinobacter xestospongiae]MCK7566780.1 DUF3080 domain-containing protein [Marinobacter xestospongiae]UDL03692.1 DUF3080 domain-containing protein [Marinobacter sp. CA1]